MDTEIERLRAVINDQATTIVRLNHEISMLHRTLANQCLAFKLETDRLRANQQENEAAPI